jgi:hypothetical protein
MGVREGGRNDPMYAHVNKWIIKKEEEKKC